MFQPQYDEPSGGKSSGRMAKLAFVIGGPAAARAEAEESARAADTFHTGDPECTKWLNERLTACYND